MLIHDTTNDMIYPAFSADIWRAEFQRNGRPAYSAGSYPSLPPRERAAARREFIALGTGPRAAVARGVAA